MLIVQIFVRPGLPKGAVFQGDVVVTIHLQRLTWLFTTAFDIE
jgi:hypothetical protein